MTEPELTVDKLVHYDEQGRQLYRCPSAGCGDTAYFDDDGKGHCPTDEAMRAFMRQAMADVQRLVPEASGIGLSEPFPVHLIHHREGQHGC